jgi:hypothetical protein
MIRCLNVISSPNFVPWRIFTRMPGRSRRSVSMRGTLLKVPPPPAIILDPARIEPQPRGIIIFLVVHLPPRPGKDEGDNEDELEYQEVIPEGEDDDNASEAEEVRMSSM